MKNRPPRKPGADRRSGPFSAKSRPFGKKDGPRQEEGPKRGFSKRPARFAKKDDAPREEGFKRGFSKPSSRFAKEEDAPRSKGFKRGSSKPSSRFDRKDDAPRTERDKRDFPKKTPRFARKPSSHKNKTYEPRTERRSPSVVEEPKTFLPAPKGLLLWGTHAVREAWLNPKRHCLNLWATQSGEKEIEETIQKAEKLGVARPQLTRIEKSDLDRLLPRGAVPQGLLLEVEPLKDMTLDDLLGRDEAPSLVVLLDQVTDPHNVGAILRSAAAFGADAVIVTERNAPNTTGILAKTASGALEHVPLIAVVNLARALDALRAESFWCIGLAEEGEKDIAGTSLHSGRIALVLGAEGEGLRRLTREHCDELARLPTAGPIGSLNVSNAAATALYEAKRQRS